MLSVGYQCKNRDQFSEGYSRIDLLSVVPPNETVEPEPVVNARRLYRSCVNETAIETDGVDAILSLVNTEFGGWPILQGSSWDGSTFNLTKLLIALRKYNNNVIFRVGTSTDEKNSTSYDIEVRLNKRYISRFYRLLRWVKAISASARSNITRRKHPSLLLTGSS